VKWALNLLEYAADVIEDFVCSIKIDFVFYSVSVCSITQFLNAALDAFLSLIGAWALGCVRNVWALSI
jgi:hypothetical protein